MARKLTGADDRRAKLRKKAQEEIDNAGREGKRKSIMNFGEDVSWYKPVDTNAKNNYQVNRIDIIPFIIESENHPDVRRSNGGLEVGDPNYELDLFIHFNMGVNADMPVLCLAKTYGEKCPICEDRGRMFDSANRDDKLIDKLRPRHRVFYNIIDKNSEDNTTKIWDSSAFLFKEVMGNKLKIMKARGKGELAPADWEEGCTICFTGEMTKGGADFEYIKFIDFEFEDRNYTYPDPASKDGKENAYSLGLYITPPTYEEVWEIYYGEKMGTPSEDKETPDHIAIRKPHKIEEEETVQPEEDENPCPGGYVFGKENQKHDMCSGGDIDGIVCGDETFNACEKAKEEEPKPTRGRR
jgi:hypothetical protein